MSAAKRHLKAHVLQIGDPLSEESKKLAKSLASLNCFIEQIAWPGFCHFEKINNALHQADLILVAQDDINVHTLMPYVRDMGKPTIVLGKDDRAHTKIECFQSGVDDYIVKPYNPTEVALRITAALKRYLGVHFSEYDDGQIQSNGIFLNRLEQSVKIDDQKISVTPLEFKLLWILVSYEGKILSKPYTYQAVLGREYGPFDRTIDMHLSRIRKKMAQAGWTQHPIRTIRGKGYTFG